ncbi:hypothetical protein AMECASPLE_035096 [Ameca splendens]|uniref:Uncharacterized protein n=1 Tax=Ameca splendens TaxID=208324 RepID=A0ABV0ZT57_9TELE
MYAKTSDHTAHHTLKQVGHSSRRPLRVPLLSSKTRNSGQHSHMFSKPEQQQFEKLLLCPISLFSCDIQVVGSELGANGMKAWIHQSCISRSGWWWVVGDIFLAYFTIL